MLSESISILLSTTFTFLTVRWSFLAFIALQPHLFTSQGRLLNCIPLTVTLPASVLHIHLQCTLKPYMHHIFSSHFYYSAWIFSTSCSFSSCFQTHNLKHTMDFLFLYLLPLHTGFRQADSWKHGSKVPQNLDLIFWIMRFKVLQKLISFIIKSAV